MDLTPGFNGLDKDNCKMRWETFQIWDLVRLILEILQYVLYHDDAMTWVCFLHYIVSQKGKVEWNFEDFFVVSLNMLLKKTVDLLAIRDVMCSCDVTEMKTKVP